MASRGIGASADRAAAARTDDSAAGLRAAGGSAAGGETVQQRYEKGADKAIIHKLFVSRLKKMLQSGVLKEHPTKVESIFLLAARYVASKITKLCWTWKSERHSGGREELALSAVSQGVSLHAVTVSSSCVHWCNG